MNENGIQKCSAQVHLSDLEIGEYGFGCLKMSLMQCGECAGLFITRKWWTIVVSHDPGLSPQPLSEAGKAHETSLARKYKDAAKEGRVCLCRGGSPIRGPLITEKDLPRDYVVEELVELIKSQR